MTAPVRHSYWPEGLPVGVRWPDDDTPVLLHRELVPGTSADALCRFGEDRWRLDEAVFEEHAGAVSLNFAAIPTPLRLSAKHYIWQLINHDYPSPFRRAAAERVAIRTVVTAWPSFKEFMVWLHRQQIDELGLITESVLDDYLIHVGEQSIALDVKFRRIYEVRRLWGYRSILPERMRLPELPPWGGDPARELFGKAKRFRENRTRRIAEATMQSLLHWALRFVEDFADDILAAHAEYRRLKSRTPEGRRARGPVPFRPTKGDVEQRMRVYLDGLRETDGSLPGKVSADGTVHIDGRHVGMILEFSFTPNTFKSPAGKLLLTSGLPIADNAYLDMPITAELDGQPWHDGPITYQGARLLAQHLSTACMIVIAYLSGARPGEVLNLRRGCIEHDSTADMWLMSGVFFKNAVDADGNKLPAGAQRRDPWVVVKPVADAVAVLESLHNHELLIPSRIEPYRRARNFSRVGEARNGSVANANIHEFIDWVNDFCRERERPGIPPDPRGRVNNSRFRRTLAWFIRRRPRGLVAGAIQYGHVHTRLIQGYAGDYNSGFPDEYAYEDFLARLDELAADEQALRNGEHVTGPAADTYRQRVSAAHRQFGGHVLTSDKQARDLLGNPLLQIYHGDGMTCVFNPHEAACQLRGTTDDPLVTPDIDDCRPRCLNIARTDRDIAKIRARRSELQEVVNDTLAPPIRRQREQQELHRLNAILEKHQ